MILIRTRHIKVWVDVCLLTCKKQHKTWSLEIPTHCRLKINLFEDIFGTVAFCSIKHAQHTSAALPIIHAWNTKSFLSCEEIFHCKHAHQNYNVHYSDDFSMNIWLMSLFQEGLKAHKPTATWPHQLVVEHNIDQGRGIRHSCYFDKWIPSKTAFHDIKFTWATTRTSMSWNFFWIKPFATAVYWMCEVFFRSWSSPRWQCPGRARRRERTGKCGKLHWALAQRSGDQELQSANMTQRVEEKSKWQYYHEQSSPLSILISNMLPWAWEILKHMRSRISLHFEKKETLQQNNTVVQKNDCFSAFQEARAGTSFAEAKVVFIEKSTPEVLTHLARWHGQECAWLCTWRKILCCISEFDDAFVSFRAVALHTVAFTKRKNVVATCTMPRANSTPSLPTRETTSRSAKLPSTCATSLQQACNSQWEEYLITNELQ